MIRYRKRVWALLLSAALIVTQLPAVAMAENHTPEDTVLKDGSIASFEPLPSGMAKQAVAVGTELSELDLPDTVTAAVYRVSEDTLVVEDTGIPDEDDIEADSGAASPATPSDAQSSVSGNRTGEFAEEDNEKTVTAVATSMEEIPVTWDSEPAYDGDRPGKYVFTADAGDYVLSRSAKLPAITVTVTADMDTVENPTVSRPEAPLLCAKTKGCILQSGHEGRCVTEQPPANDALVKTITGWKFVSTEYSDYIGNELAIPSVSMERQADLAMVVSMLPTQISADIDGEQASETLDITRWDCPEYVKTGEGSWPVSGEYTFNAALPPGYSCDPLPAIQVMIGGGDLLSGGASWNGQSSKTASGLGVSSGETITITGSNSNPNGAILTIDVDDITVTSGGRPVIGVSILVEPGVNTLTIMDLDLTPVANNIDYGIKFKSTSTLIVKGECTIYGPLADGNLREAIYSADGLNLKVTDGSELHAIGDREPTERGNYGIRTWGSLTVDVGNGGNLTVESTKGRLDIGSALYSGESLTINNNGIVLATTIGAGSAVEYGIKAGGDTTLSGSGTTTAKGVIGLSVNGDLTVDGPVVAEGTDIGVILQENVEFSKLSGSGELTVKAIGNGNSGERGNGMWVINSGLDLAFEGKLTVHGGIGGSGYGIYVQGPLTVSKTPIELDVQKGTGPFAFGSYSGSLTNYTDMNIFLNIDVPVAWPDVVLPSVLSVVPGPYAGLDGRIEIIFSETIKDGPGTVTLTENESGDAITLTGGYWNVPYWEYSGKSWLFIDYAGLKPGTTYTVNISGFQDKAGNVMAADSSHTFTTVPGGATTSVATPVAAPAGGAYSTAQTVTLTCATGGATIVYTLDGSDPLTSGTWQIYSAPFTVPLGTTLKACAVAPGYWVSTVLTEIYTKKPSSGGSSGGGDGSYSAYKPQSSYAIAGERISQIIPRSDLRQLANDRKSLTLSCDKASMIFAPAALNAILEATADAADSKVTFAAAPADLSAFPDAAKLIGAHPVYSFTVSYKDGQGNLVAVPVNFPAGSAAITLNDTPTVAEVTGNLFMVYVDGKGAVTWLDKSSYKVNGGEAGREGDLGYGGGKVLAEVPHFSTYGVAYKAPVPVFTDITNHWAKEDIEFVAARGLLVGTENDLFSPDGTMTRGMFVTALGRLAGINPDGYQTRSFTDVKADAYYAAYAEWAAQKNIVKGTGDKLFSPDAPVTREEMAVMMVNYAGQMGYSIPAPLAAITFADNDEISAWAEKEVAAMQRAGIVRGKDENRFDPQGNATRAEGSVVLRRFVEIVIVPATATGWMRNDSGHWLYYKGGKALTGWREIGGKWHYFDENGVMAVNTKVDGYEVGPDGARKDSN